MQPRLNPCPETALSMCSHEYRTRPASQILDCTGLCLLTDESLVLLGLNCPRLRKLNLSWCKKIGDETVCAVARGCQLQLISLHGNLNVTEASRKALVTHCASTLQEIDVRGCMNFPRSHPQELLADLPRLRTFLLHT